MAGLVIANSMCPHWSRLTAVRQPFTRLFGSVVTNSSKSLPSFTPFKKLYSTKNAWEINTNVAKDVVLYAFDNGKFHRYLNIFAVTQFAFWMYLAAFAKTTLKDAPVAKEESSSGDQPWYRRINLGENKYRTGITTMCMTVGILFLGGSWLYALRAVRNVVLRKGGQEVTLITHAPFNRLRYLDVPLKNVSAMQSRRASGAVQVPVKIKGRMGYFLIDTKGEFKNGPLFDATVGLKRILK